MEHSDWIKGWGFRKKRSEMGDPQSSPWLTKFWSSLDDLRGLPIGNLCSRNWVVESWGLSQSNLENPHQPIEVILEGNFRAKLPLVWFHPISAAETSFTRVCATFHRQLFNSQNHFQIPSCALKIQYSTKLVAQGVDYFNGSGWSCKAAEGSTACIGGIGGTMIGSNMTLGATGQAPQATSNPG